MSSTPLPVLSHLTPGRLLLSIVAIFNAAGAFYFDWNETHVLNPRWPGHARFHNGQTMTLGVLLATNVLYYTFRHHPDPNNPSITSPSGNSAAATPSPPPPPPPAAALVAQKDSIRTAAIFATLYWVAGLAAWFFPGSLAVDHEFGDGFPQLPLFSAMVALAWMGWGLEMRRLAGLELVVGMGKGKGKGKMG